VLETVLVLAILGAVFWAYRSGKGHGKASVESDQLKAMAESVKRGIDARRKVAHDDGGDDPGGMRERSFRD